MKILSAFQLLFYGGAWVQDQQYKSLICSLREQVNTSVSFMPSLFFDHPLSRPGEKVYLIGHSLGGVRAAWDAMMYPKRVAGLILINSHFNERNRMMYPGLSQENIHVPTLVMMAGRDDRLPINKALDDYFVKLREQYYDHLFVVNKDLDHFDGVTTTRGRDQIVGPVVDFLRGDLAKLREQEKVLERRFAPDIEMLSQDVYVNSRAFGVIDALLKMVLPRWIWNSGHWIQFLCSDPKGFEHYMYEDDAHVFWKGRTNDDLANIHERLRKWTGSNDVRVRKLKLYNNILSRFAWMFLPLYVSHSKRETSVAVLEIPQKNNLSLFKIPHPDRIYGALPINSLL